MGEVAGINAGTRGCMACRSSCSQDAINPFFTGKVPHEFQVLSPKTWERGRVGAGPNGSIR